MKKRITKIISTTLALLVLFSTFSFKVEKHFCGDFLVDVSYIGKLATCNDIEEDSCEKAGKEVTCCNDAVEFVKGQDQIQKQSSKEISFVKENWVLTSNNSYELFFVVVEKELCFFNFYAPPDIIENLQLLHEVYII